MARPTTLAECLAEYSPSVAAPGSPTDRAVRRAFMQGAMATLQLRRTGATHEQLLSECIQFGRAVGTPAETATA